MKVYGDCEEYDSPVKINSITWSKSAKVWETETICYDWHSESKDSTLLNYFGRKVFESGRTTTSGQETTLVLPNRPNTYYECLPIT